MELLFIILFVILLMIIATIRFKVHPVFSLTVAALISGIFFGFGPSKTIEYVSAGFGNTLSSIGLIIAFGTIIGVFLEKNGGTQIIANRILKLVPDKRSPLAMNIVGFIISIPVFCDSGFIILSSLNKALSKKTGIPLMVFAVCLATGLYATHVFVPPTPGPLAAAAILEADLGLVMIIGLCIAIPVSLIGVVWGNFIGKREPQVIEESTTTEETSLNSSDSKSSLTLVLLPIILPILLIGLKSIANYPSLPLGEGWFLNIIDFLGNPVIALLVGVICVFIWAFKVKGTNKQEWTVNALKEAGVIILITGAGGAFGNVLREADLGSIFSSDLNIIGGGLLLAFFISSALKSAQGSSTVAIIATAAIVAPLLGNFGLETDLEKALSVLAIGAGALTVSHVNDSYFWVVSQFSDLSVKEALKSHTVATLLQGLTGIILVIIINIVMV